MEATTCSPPSKEIEIHHRRLAGGRRVLRPRAASATRERVGCYILAMLRPSRRNRRVGRSKRIRKAAGAQPLLCRGRHPRRPTSDVSHRRICRPWPASAPLPEPCWCCSADGATRRDNGSSAAAREDGEVHDLCRHVGTYSRRSSTLTMHGRRSGQPAHPPAPVAGQRPRQTSTIHLSTCA